MRIRFLQAYGKYRKPGHEAQVTDAYGKRLCDLGIAEWVSFDPQHTQPSHTRPRRPRRPDYYSYRVRKLLAEAREWLSGADFATLLATLSVLVGDARGK